MSTEILNNLDRCLTVRELMDELSAMDQDAKVLFACDYGDISHTQQALMVRDLEELDSSDLRESGYSYSRMAIVEDEGDEHGDRRPAQENGSIPIVVLR